MQNCIPGVIKICFFLSLLQGTIVFVSLRVVELDGTQWLRGPDGWLLEKLTLCGECCVAGQGSASSSSVAMCSHESYFLVPLCGAELALSTGADDGAQPEERDDAATESHAAAPSSSSAPNPSRQQAQSSAIYSRTNLPSRYAPASPASNSAANRPAFSADVACAPNEGELDLARNALKGMERDVLSVEAQRIAMSKLRIGGSTTTSSSGEEGDGGRDARLTRMLQLQGEMEAMTRRLVELNQAVLSCQLSVSQLIKGQITHFI